MGVVAELELENEGLWLQQMNEGKWGPISKSSLPATAWAAESRIFAAKDFFRKTKTKAKAKVYGRKRIRRSQSQADRTKASRGQSRETST